MILVRTIHNNNDPIVMATTMMSVRECLCSIVKLLVSTNPVVTNVNNCTGCRRHQHSKHHAAIARVQRAGVGSSRRSAPQGTADWKRMQADIPLNAADPRFGFRIRISLGVRSPNIIMSDGGERTLRRLHSTQRASRLRLVRLVCIHG